MTRAWFSQPLETVATWWRILRCDGVALGFTAHDRDLWIDGILHRASPGMLPSAIRRSVGLDDDSADVSGALTHDSVSTADLASGRFNDARVRIGVIDWETGENECIWVGTIGAVSEDDGQFCAELASRKRELLRSPVPRTSPACRAEFCGPGCNLNPSAFTHEGVVSETTSVSGALGIDCAADLADIIGGTLRWLDGPLGGTTAFVAGLDDDGALVLDPPIGVMLPAGLHVTLREGCDHGLGTCANRFGNAANFRGEPFLPGNDLLARYPTPRL